MRTDPFAQAFENSADASPRIDREEWWSPIGRNHPGFQGSAGNAWLDLLLDPATAGGLTAISSAVPEPRAKEPLVLTPSQRWAIGLIGVGIGVILYRKTAR